MTLIANGAVYEKSRLMLCMQVFLPKLVLEVLGGAGAIWGFSEAVGLRNESNIWFWRPVALSVGSLFLARWLKQVHIFLTWQEDEVEKPRVEGELSSLVLQETIAFEHRLRTV
eukprot:scaffold858_cov123-Cylindrotheca_fusiformis.AAC.10